MGFFLKVAVILFCLVHFTDAHNIRQKLHSDGGDGVQPLSKIQILKAVSQLHENAFVSAYPVLLGTEVRRHFVQLATISFVVSMPYFHFMRRGKILGG